MDLALSDEQVTLSRSIRAWSSRHQDSAGVRAFAEDRLSPTMSPLWSAARELGWLGAASPERVGGSGGSLLDAALITSSLGYGLSPDFVGYAIRACEVLKLCAEPDQQRQWLSGIVSGKLLPALSLTNYRGAVGALPVTVDDQGRLDGDAGVVAFADDADILIVAVTSPTGVMLRLVGMDQAGVRRKTAEPSDLTVRAARVTLSGVPSVGLGHLDSHSCQRALRHVTVLSAADIAGVAERALELTVEHLSVRNQFGRPVGSFQAAQHELADLHVALTTLHHAVYYAAHALEQDEPDSELLSAIVKMHGSDLAKRLAEAIVQWHGALGFTWEHDAHLFFKRLYRAAYDYGDAAVHAETVTAVSVAAAPGK